MTRPNRERAVMTFADHTAALEQLTLWLDALTVEGWRVGAMKTVQVEGQPLEVIIRMSITPKSLQEWIL